MKIAPMTENGNNCPTSEQAANRAGEELCPAFPGSERVREPFDAKTGHASPQRWHGPLPAKETLPVKTASIHTSPTQLLPGRFP
jgi:hypothetical protein